jgi:hypothetical protein
MYNPSYGWLQDDVIYQRLIGWRAPVARYAGPGLDWMFPSGWYGGNSMGAGWKPGMGGIRSTFAGIHLPDIAQLLADAQAVKSGQMSLDEYAARHGSSPTQNDIQYLANALGLDVMGMDGNNAWLQVNLIKAVYAGGLDAGNQIAIGTYGVINVALGVGRKDLLNALSKTNSSQTGGDPQTWYYMSRDGSPHGMVYDPVGRYIYEINQVPGQSKLEQLEGLILNSFPSNNVKANISVAYQYKQGSPEWSRLWAREIEMGSVFLLSPVTVSNPAAATAWFQGQTGNSWNYSLGASNCAHYSVLGLNAGGAGINFSGPMPSGFPIAPTMTWTAGQPYPVPIGR